MDKDPKDFQGNSDIFSFAGAGTVLLIALVAFIGLYPLMLGEIAGRIAGGSILAMLFVTGAITASKSTVHRSISVALAILALALQAVWLSTHKAPTAGA
jgi:hypothetical protein